MMSTPTLKHAVPNLRHVYKRLLRLASKYPSRNKDKIFKSIQEEFRINASLAPDSEVNRVEDK